MKKSPSSENGNALWFILLAIGLMTALALTVTRSSDTSEETGGTERATLYASEVLRYAAAIEQVVEQMRLDGVSENEISFDNAITAATYTNSRCQIDGCIVFSSGSQTGGGMVYKSISADVSNGNEWLFTGANNVEDVGTNGTGPTSSTDNELLIMLPDVAEAFCRRVNAELGIDNIPQNSGKTDITTPYTGTYPDGWTINALPGKKTGCFEGDDDENGGDISGKYYFYHTLIAR